MFLRLPFCSRLEVKSSLKANRLRDEIVAHHLLPVVDVATAVLAEVAMNILAGFTFVDVVTNRRLALGDLEGRLGHYLVEGESRAGEIFAGVTMAFEWKLMTSVSGEQ